MSSKPAIPKGTRDFPPEEMLKREFIFETIKSVFRLYGYQPVETPAMENLTALLGKYGDEGDRLIFRILNSGDFLSGITDDELLSREYGKISSKICEKGLRYDLTVPFARFVVQHRNEIVFPFRRYQIQPVWRADRPQKGRYREFFQCDVDVIGSDSLLNEYELIRIIDDVFSQLNISVIIKINNRKVLYGIIDYIGEGGRVTDITVAIDKLEKIGLAAVISELREKGLSEEAIAKLEPVLGLSGTAYEKLAILKKLLSESDGGKSGITELETLFSYIDSSEIRGKTEFDLTLARGLNYYTGAIIEVKSSDVGIGSICGGGRYDNLTGVFGLEGISGVGVSFGADRIYDVMMHLGLFGENNTSSTEVLVMNFGGPETIYELDIVQRLRKIGVRSEFYPDQVKLKKQLSYAGTRKIPYVIIAGEEEMKNNEFTLRDMTTGEQKRLPLSDLESFIQEQLS